jgi:hypothetical protein
MHVMGSVLPVGQYIDIKEKIKVGRIKGIKMGCRERWMVVKMSGLRGVTGARELLP